MVDVLIENSSKSSVPSNSFMAMVLLAELSSHIVPATADDGLDDPMCCEFKALILLFRFALNVLNAWLSNVTCDTCALIKLLLVLLLVL